MKAYWALTAAPSTFDSVPADGSAASLIGDVAHIRTLLIEAARHAEPVSYSRVLGQLGLRFTRPRMRALCRTLDRIDAEAAAASEPELAVLVVRESDGLPGQGWWLTNAAAHDHAGAWTGPVARRLVQRLQLAAFHYWQARPSPTPQQ